MGKQQLKALIDQVSEIEQEFTNEYHNMAYFNGVASGMNFPTIHKSEKYQQWRAMIEAQLSEASYGELANDIKDTFKSIENGWNEDGKFTRLKSQLAALNDRLNDQDIPNAVLDAYSEEKLNDNLLHACIEVQSNHSYHGKLEDEINDGVRGCLRMIYEVNDQTRQGVSESGMQAGEVDLLIRNSGVPVAILEALRMSSLTKENLSRHMNKVLENYDPVGCPFVFVLVYAMSENFADFWERLQNYIKEYDFNYRKKDEFQESSTGVTEIRRTSVTLERSGKDVRFCVYALNMR